MNVLFKVMMWFSLRYGHLPKLAKQLRKEGKLEAAAGIEAGIKLMGKANSMEEVQKLAEETAAQTARDLRIKGRHSEADGLDAIGDSVKRQNRQSRRKRR